jgi:hypothetical protein
MSAQIDLFGPVTTAPSTSLIGLQVTLERRPCLCGGITVTVGSSVGPHYAVLKCSACDRYRGWLSHDTAHFLNTIIDNFGRPTEPVVVRNSRTSADDSQSQLQSNRKGIKPCS